MTHHFARRGVPTQFSSVLARLGITDPTPIQAATLPDSLAGRDVLGRGRSGSGKTYAFLLPVVTRLAADRRRAVSRHPRALILAPTRELANQSSESLRPLAAAAQLSHHTVYGGVGQHPQVQALSRGVDILVACPGRLLDLMGQGHVDLGSVEVTVIDEADHMADMGFLPMVRRILDRTGARGQRMLFSATLDEGVGVLVKRYLHQPVIHEADSALSPVGTMDHHVLAVAADERVAVVADLAAAPGRTIVFTRTKHGAKKLARQLVATGVPAVELHGNLGQGARTRNLNAFHSGAVQTLVATDIAARGIHVDEVALVVHADPPTEHKAYLHRSGRTARAGNSGTVITLMTPDQRSDVRSLLRAARISPTIADARPGSAVLGDLAPGERTFLAPERAHAIANPEAARSASVSTGSTGRTGSRSRTRGRGPRAGATASAGGRARRGGQGAAAFSSRSRVGSGR